MPNVNEKKKDRTKGRTKEGKEGLKRERKTITTKQNERGRMNNKHKQKKQKERTT